jgi:hypothetical protein
MAEAKFATVQGACDLHCHAGKPSCDERPFMDAFIARQAAAAGMEALVFKSHYENTVARAYYVNQIVPEIRLFGGIALNRYVGGLNPSAVEATLTAGGKEVWMPGIDSACHGEAFGGTGSYEVEGKVVGPRQMLGRKRDPAEGGIRVTEMGKLKKEAVEIVRLVAEHDAILTSGHLYKEEIFELARCAREEGAKFLIDHPFFHAPGFTYGEIDQLKELAKLGAYISFFTAQVFPCDLATNITGDKKCMEKLGPENCVIASDSGAAPYPIPNEALRVYAQNLFDIGVPLEHLETMMVNNPRRLLSL